MKPNRPESGWKTKARTGSASAQSALPQASASPGARRPEGIGRLRVRRINASTCRSYQQLRALAPLTSTPTARTASRLIGQERACSGKVRLASQTPDAAVSTTVDVMRGLVTATSSRTRLDDASVAATAVFTA